MAALTAEMKQLLAAAQATGGVIPLLADPHGEYVHIGARRFDDDRERRRRYVEALEGLLRDGFVERRGAVRHELTPEGWDVARLIVPGQEAA